MRLLEPLFNWTGVQASNSAGVPHVVVGKSIERDDRTEGTNTECKTRCTEWNCVWSGLQEAALELSYILKLNTKRKRARQLYQHLAWEIQSRLAPLHARSLLDQSKLQSWDMGAAIVLSDAQKKIRSERHSPSEVSGLTHQASPDLHFTHAAHARAAPKSASQLVSSQIFRWLWIN